MVRLQGRRGDRSAHGIGWHRCGSTAAVCDSCQAASAEHGLICFRAIDVSNLPRNGAVERAAVLALRSRQDGLALVAATRGFGCGGGSNVSADSLHLQRGG